ncbi:MAG TPA: class II aldolase/adducin family protein [Burkholderiaceae bacterium]|nr:class II aldolase/adducin family protein [Burkholderiaceae bacterium]
MTLDPILELEAAAPAGADAAEWKLRVQLAACYRVFAALGWIELIFNHITLRVPGGPGEGPAFLINPFGLTYREVTARNLVKVGHDGLPLQETPHHVNRAGFVIHSAVHAARADAHCVMHTHTTAGMAVAGKKGGLSYDNFYGAELFGDVAYHDFEGITVHADEGPRLVASLADKRVLILRNHGLLVVGADVFGAFRWMWTLQRACEVQLAADSLRGDDIVLADHIREACGRDARAFEPRGQLERLLFLSVLRDAGVDPASLI